MHNSSCCLLLRNVNLSQVDPDLDKSPFSEEEEDTLIELHKQVYEEFSESRWAEIAKRFPRTRNGRRAENDIKNIFNSAIRNKDAKRASCPNQSNEGSNLRAYVKSFDAAHKAKRASANARARGSGKKSTNAESKKRKSAGSSSSDKPCAPSTPPRHGQRHSMRKVHQHQRMTHFDEDRTMPSLSIDGNPPPHHGTQACIAQSELPAAEDSDWGRETDASRIFDMIVSPDLDDFLNCHNADVSALSQHHDDETNVTKKAPNTKVPGLVGPVVEDTRQEPLSGRSSLCSETVRLATEAMEDLLPNFQDGESKGQEVTMLESDHRRYFPHQGLSHQIESNVAPPEPRPSMTYLHVSDVPWDHGICARVEPEKGCSFSVFVTRSDPSSVQQNKSDGQNFTCSQFGTLPITDTLARQFGADDSALCQRLKDILINMCGTICTNLRHQVTQAYSVEVYVCTSDSRTVSSSLVVNVKAWEAATACIIGSESVQAVLNLT